MAEIYVESSADLNTIITELNIKNEKLRRKAEAVSLQMTSVGSKWKGDASTAFLRHWQQEHGNFETLAKAIDKYAQALVSIRDAYESAETTNTGIAEQ